MSRTTRKHINYKTGRVKEERDNKPRCQCCCNPRHSAFGNKLPNHTTSTNHMVFYVPELRIGSGIR